MYICATTPDAQSSSDFGQPVRRLSNTQGVMHKHLGGFEKDSSMNLPFVLAGLTALGLLVYLVAVLIRPERF